MKDWKSYQLGELYDVSSGLSKSKDSFGFGETFISFKDVFYNWFLPLNPIGLVNSSEKDQLTCSVLKGDILITRTSETSDEIGMTSVALKDYPNSTFNGFCKRLRIKKETPLEISPLFIGYLFRSRYFRKTVAQYATMTTRASLNSDSIKRMSFRFPSFLEQKTIADILTSFDDKIQNLQAQNKTLETTAQTIFKEWFGKYQIGDELPEGWRVGKLEEIVDVFDSQRIPLSKAQREERKGKFRYYGATSVMDYIDDYLFDGVYLLFAEDGSVIDDKGNPFLQYVWGQFWVNNHAHILQGENGFSTEILYVLCKKMRVAGIVTGAVQLKINQKNLLGFEIVIPDEGILLKFDNTIQPLFMKLRMNNTQIQTLKKTRDTLLPKLMSGQLRVKMSLL